MHDNHQSLHSNINTLVDMVYVLSVKSFTERIAHIKSLMQRHDINFKFIFEHDIPEIKKEMLEETFSTSCTLSMAQKSLVLKHIQAWRNALQLNFKRIVVFEDDVFFNKNFDKYFEHILTLSRKLDDGYLVFLGGADAKVPDYFLLSSDLLVPLPIATTEGYITDISAVERRLNWISENKVSLPADHLICKMDNILNIQNYWSRYALVEQGSVNGFFTSQLDSHRRKHSVLFNVLRYRWNKFQRHTLKRWIALLRQSIR
jgi:glycosyl transferase, family 25